MFLLFIILHHYRLIWCSLKQDFSLCFQTKTVPLMQSNKKDMLNFDKRGGKDVHTSGLAVRDGNKKDTVST